MAQFATIFALLCGAGYISGGVVPINDGKYILDTRVTLGGILHVKITTESTGWVGWGISPNGSNVGSDMVMGGWDPARGAYFGVSYIVLSEFVVIDGFI